jgi:hypothetical protein
VSWSLPQGQIVDATIRAIVDQTDGLKFQIGFRHEQTALVDVRQVVREYEGTREKRMPGHYRILGRIALIAAFLLAIGGELRIAIASLAFALWMIWSDVNLNVSMFRLELEERTKQNTSGAVMKLDSAAFEKLDLFKRLSQVMMDSGFVEEEVKRMKPHLDLQKQAFSAYALAYSSWDKPAEISRPNLDEIVTKAAGSIHEANLTPTERARLDAFLAKFKCMMSAAFDLGRHDANSQLRT